VVNVLLSAYACVPGKGSDPEIGWNWMREIAREHQVWVLTRASKRTLIENELAVSPSPNAHFVYVDLPPVLRFWKKWTGGVYLYYYLWQLLAFFKARKLHRDVTFDLIHHVTFGTYWLPSFLCLLQVPFVWGPVGGAERAPATFRSAWRLRGRVYELVRSAVQACSALDPFVRLTAKRATLALATSDETAKKIAELGSQRVHVLSCVGFPSECSPDFNEHRNGEGFRVFSAGRLLHWKGFDLGIRAVAEISARVPTLEYWIFGDGPERAALEQLAEDFGIAAQVRFHPDLPRRELLLRMPEFDALLHPSLHDSGGLVCVEAMSAGCAVLCLDLGGPALQVTGETGFRIPAISPAQCVQDLAAALELLASDSSLRARMARAGRERVRNVLAWEAKLRSLNEIYTRT